MNSYYLINPLTRVFYCAFLDELMPSLQRLTTASVKLPSKCSFA